MQLLVCANQTHAKEQPIVPSTPYPKERMTLKRNHMLNEVFKISPVDVNHLSLQVLKEFIDKSGPSQKFPSEV